MISEITYPKDKKRYLQFIRNIYSADSEYCDMNLMFVETFLYEKDGYAKRVERHPILAHDRNGSIRAVGIFICDETDTIKLSFLEFAQDSLEYLIEIKKYGEALARQLGKKKIVVGINGQISYGLGVLGADGDRHFEFNSNYNPAYYDEMLVQVFPKRKNVYSYLYDLSELADLFEHPAVARCYRKYTFRNVNMKHYHDEMLLFGQLVHECLRDTPYYSEKTPEEFYELMKPMRWLMKPDDLIFAFDDGEPVGFIYTHPDYAELFDKPRLNYVKVLIRLKRMHPHRIICNVIGVDSSHKNTGIAVALVAKAAKSRLRDYDDVVSSFVIEENEASTSFCRKLSHDTVHKKLYLYELSVGENEGLSNA